MTLQEPRDEPDLERAVEEAARLIGASRHVVALVGAGLSAESGVPTFRGPEGLWTKHGEPDLRDYERFVEDPKRWWEMRQERASRLGELVQALETAVPNAGHFALRDLEEMGQLAAHHHSEHRQPAPDRGERGYHRDSR